MQKEIMLKDFLGSWLSSVIKGNVRANSYTAYCGYIYNHINGIIGNLPLNEIRPETIQGFVQTLSGKDKKLSAKTVHSIYTMLKGSLQCAVDYELIVKTPCSKIRLPKITEKEIKVFNRSEQSKIEAAILSSNDNRNIGVLICLYTGIRIGELCALKWENVDIKNKNIKIKYSLNRVSNMEENNNKTCLTEEEPKTKKSKRQIFIPEFLCTILKKHKKDGKSPYVISMKNGNPVQPRTMQQIYTRLLKAADIRYCNFHTLRHTFATRAIELDVDIKTISETLGHSNTSITINLYVHSLMEQKQKMMRKFNDFFCKQKNP